MFLQCELLCWSWLPYVRVNQKQYSAHGDTCSRAAGLRGGGCGGGVGTSVQNEQTWQTFKIH